MPRCPATLTDDPAALPFPLYFVRRGQDAGCHVALLPSLTIQLLFPFHFILLGEGKTLVATLPCYLNALRRSSGGVHVITVNDYLSARDAEWMGKLYNFLGLSCRAVQSGMTGEQYKHAFSADIVYVTGQELGFTYLRDNTAQLEQELVGRGRGGVKGRGGEGRDGGGGGRGSLNVEERREWIRKALKGVRVVRDCGTFIVSNLCM